MAARIWAHELARVCNARGFPATWLRAANVETVCLVQSQLSSQPAICVAFELPTEGQEHTKHLAELAFIGALQAQAV